MVRRILGAVVVLAVCLGFVVADEFKGKVTKVDGNKITVENKKDNKTMDFDIAGVKVQKGGKDGAKVAAEASAIKEGSAVSVTHEGGKASEVVIMGGKKKTN